MHYCHWKYDTELQSWLINFAKIPNVWNEQKFSEHKRKHSTFFWSFDRNQNQKLRREISKLNSFFFFLIILEIFDKLKKKKKQLNDNFLFQQTKHKWDNSLKFFCNYIKENCNRWSIELHKTYVCKTKIMQVDKMKT